MLLTEHGYDYLFAGMRCVVKIKGLITLFLMCIAKRIILIEYFVE